MIENLSRREPLCRFSSNDETDPASIPPLLKRIYENRNVAKWSQVTDSLDQLYPPKLLKDVDIASDIICRAVIQGDSILIVGDYDVDGATGTTLGVLALREMGAREVDYLVPNRFNDGYGLSEKIAALALARSPDVLITVDNGISSIEGVALLRKQQVKVIITDHHLSGQQLPPADAIVNPNQPGCDFPSKALAGVGVMFYLLTAVRIRLRQAEWFLQQDLPMPNLAKYLDLVALGTVADMVPLDRNNRILVAQGIARIRSGGARPGIAALMEVAGKSVDKVATSDFGFAIAPSLNAAGRLDDISTGIECLLSASEETARSYAGILNQINMERRSIEKTMQKQAFGILRTWESERREKPDTQMGLGVCLFEPSWHQGIVGLVASRIKERLAQPAIVFARAGDGMLTGSARSIPGLHIRDLIESIALQHPALIVKFGGHAMAAGLTIDESDFTDFHDFFRTAVQQRFAEFGYEAPVILSDGELDHTEMTLPYAELLRNAAPWGQGFPGPLFDGVFDVAKAHIVAEQHIRFLLRNTDGESYDAIAFRAVNPGEEHVISRLKRVHVAYQLDVNEFRGRRSMQLIVEKFVSLCV